MSFKINGCSSLTLYFKSRITLAVVLSAGLCEDLWVVNQLVQPETLRGFNIGLMVDCIGQSSRKGGGRGQGPRESRSFRDATRDDESCSGNVEGNKHGMGSRRHA